MDQKNVQFGFLGKHVNVTFFSSKGNFCQSEDVKEDIICLSVLVLARFWYKLSFEA